MFNDGVRTSRVGTEAAFAWGMVAKRRIYEFGDYRVDTGQFCLIKAGRTQPITPTVFKILEILLERAGDSVTKDELMKSVWPDSFVEEGNLNRNVSTLRKALDEKPKDHKFIETIPKTGYRFIAPVRATDYQAPTGVTRGAPLNELHHLVGREQEAGVIRNAYQQALLGDGSLVCIGGDLGIGKTALVNGVLEQIAGKEQTFQLARVRCSESLTESEPLTPWVEGLATLNNDPAVSELMMKFAPNWYRAVSHTGSAETKKMKRELVDFCRNLSAVHPLIIFIDDFHWSDVASADLLSYLATRLESTRVLVILCYRMSELKVADHPFIKVRSELLSRRACTELCLAPLTRTDIEQLLSLEPADHEYAADHAAFLNSKFDGNPLFIRDFLKGPNANSNSLLEMIRVKIGQIDETRRQLLVTASVQGREFDSTVLAATMQLPSQDVEETLQELHQTYGVIERIREEELPDGKVTVRYRFKYALYQEACYASLAPTRKASLSSMLAEAFLASYGH